MSDDALVSDDAPESGPSRGVGEAPLAPDAPSRPAPRFTPSRSEFRSELASRG